MRFLDSSVFLHAYLIPRRELKPSEEELKRRAKTIMSKVDSRAEEVLITAVHVCRMLGIIESRLGLQASLGVLARMLSLPNIKIVDVTKEDYEEALATASQYSVSANIALAYAETLEHDINEIYTFDKHYRNLPGIKVIQE